jgi:hypothetical protein
VNPVWRHTDSIGELVLAHADLVKKFGLKDLARVGVTQQSHLFKLLMIVRDFYLASFSVVPSKTYPPLVVDPDAPLTSTIAFERFQPISRWIAQVIERKRRIELAQFPQGVILNIARKLSTPLPLPNPLGLLTGKGTDHGLPVLVRGAYHVSF